MSSQESKGISPQDIKEWIDTLISMGGWGVVVIVVFYFAFFPEKAEKLSALMWKFLRKFYKGAEKKYITHDIQGRVNDFVTGYLKKEIKEFEPAKIKIVWAEEDQTREAFLKSNSIIVRMRQSDNQNKNFVHATMVYISNTILVKAKRYISPKQKEGIDLFVARKLFEKEKREVVTMFIDEILYEKTSDAKIRDFFDKFDVIDVAGLFFPVFVQEMIFLGEKIFLKGRDPKIQEEVTGLIRFLNNYSNRRTGEDNLKTLFEGKFSKFQMVIIGKWVKLVSRGLGPYINFIKKSASKGIETIYILGDSNRKDIINQICSEQLLNEIGFSKYNQKTYPAKILNSTGKEIKVNNFLLVLRKNKIENYIRET